MDWAPWSGVSTLLTPSSLIVSTITNLILICFQSFLYVCVVSRLLRRLIFVLPYYHVDFRLQLIPLHIRTTVFQSSTAQTISATLWAGTNSGQILVFLINIAEDGEKRKTEKASAMLAKEIQLRHKAPVISIQVR